MKTVVQILPFDSRIGGSLPSTSLREPRAAPKSSAFPGRACMSEPFDAGLLGQAG